MINNVSRRKLERTFTAAKVEPATKPSITHVPGRVLPAGLRAACFLRCVPDCYQTSRVLGVVTVAPRRHRFKRRWKVERLFAWLYNFRRLVVPYEYHVENYVGLVQLACVIILLRHL